MSLSKLETNNLKSDRDAMCQSGVRYEDTIEALKLIELRRMNSHLEYLASIMENAPWNIKE